MKNKIYFIEEYLAGELSVKEQTEFEELLRNDNELMKEFLLRKEINEAIFEDDVVDLKNILNEIDISEIKARKLHRNPFVLSSVAAVAIVLIILSGLYLFSNKPMSENEVFNVYYNTYPSVANCRSISTQTDKELIVNKAFSSYDIGDYETSADYFLQTLENNKSNSMVQFYLAICDIELGDFYKSEKLLNELIIQNNHIFWEQSHWYLALVYLKQKDTENAKKIFEIIISENMVMKSESKLIMKSLS